MAEKGKEKLTVELEAAQCKVETVMVYMDRAEVCRTLKATVQEGDNEIVMKNLSPCVDKDSIRVEGRGSATITEVAVQTKALTADDDQATGEKEKELKKKIKEAQDKLDVSKIKQLRLQKQRSLLDGLAESLIKGSNNDNDKTSAVTEIMREMGGFLNLYDERATKLDDQLHTNKSKIEELRDQIGALEKNLLQITTGNESEEAKHLSVLLESSVDGDIELYVSYVVSKAKWTPKYDIRVFSTDNTMKILYYGMIQQATGENWEDCKLCLSTAMPSIGGIVPELGTQKLSFKPKINREIHLNTFGQSARKKKSRMSSFRMKNIKSNSMPMEMYDNQESAAYSDMLGGSLFEEEMSEMEVATTEVKDSITSTMYEINRRSTIPCDNTSHKVSVAIIDLKPTFEYECVPKKAAHAFLKAKVKNSSPYALLAGPTNVFLDNNFVSKAELKAVSPSEEFTCSLGVDPAVRVTYKPVHKFCEHTGIISKNVVMTYKQVIEIKNTHKDFIKLMVTDNLPLSSEEKIKVTLQEPSLKHSDKEKKPVRLNKYNNLHWDLTIGTNETKELTIKYTVEYPTSEEVEMSTLAATPDSSQC